MVDTPKVEPAGRVEAPSGAASAAKPAQGLVEKPPFYRPLFRMMGMPNFRFRLPSRNWSIFLSIVGTWYGLYWYDRREKKRIMQHWCDSVSHIAQQPFPPQLMPRKMTIVLAAPPADGLLTSREHYHEYVKPILVAGGMDWDAVEGRKEGDVRAMIAERIRDQRIKAGERGETHELDEQEEAKEIVRQMRLRLDVKNENDFGAAGDIVIGRHTWKEYVRGLHEGWLGPLYPPAQPEQAVETTSSPVPAPEQPQSEPPVLDSSEKSPVDSLTSILDDSGSSDTIIHPGAAAEKKAEEEKAAEQKKKEEEEKDKKPKKRPQPLPFIKPTDYESATLPPTIPQKLGPSITIPLQHILGFFNTPIRMYRFLHERDLANEIGRQVASAVLASHANYQQVERTTAVEDVDSGASASSLQWEQEQLLVSEEKEWHKSIRKDAAKAKEEGKERDNVWLDSMVLDPRIASRMARFLPPPDSRSSSD